MKVKAVKECGRCSGTGMEDSGGFQPWGEPIQIKCDCQDGNVVKVKTADLSGRSLDWAVAKATRKEMPSVNQWILWDDYHPTRNWLHCGPLTEKYSVSCYQSTDPVTGETYHWVGVCELVLPGKRRGLLADDPKTAICRAVVASKLGDEVDIPDELMESQQ